MEAIRETTTRNASIRAQRRPVLQTTHPTPPPIRLAWDDLESGDFTGGSGWLGDWAVVGIADVTGLGVPFEGAFHLRLRQATTTATSTAERSLDLSGQSKVRVQFQAKADAFDPGDVAQLRVSPDGVNFTTVRNWSDGQDDNVYRFEDIDLSSFSMSAEFFIAFDAVLSVPGGRFFVDDLVVVRSW